MFEYVEVGVIALLAFGVVEQGPVDDRDLQRHRRRDGTQNPGVNSIALKICHKHIYELLILVGLSVSNFK